MRKKQPPRRLSEDDQGLQHVLLARLTHVQLVCWRERDHMKKITRMVTCKTMDAMTSPRLLGSPKSIKSEALETQTEERVTRCTIRYRLHIHTRYSAANSDTRHTPWQER
jgi:hypothetical protein